VHKVAVPNCAPKLVNVSRVIERPPGKQDKRVCDGLGAAIAGLVANASGLDNGLDPGSVLRASLWVPLALVTALLAACAIGVRLNLMVPRSPEQKINRC
jgi:hypothetical protein